MSNRKMPSVMWARGRELVAQNKVQIIAVEPDMGVIEATVYGTHAYDVILGSDPQDDGCSCPYFPGHGYCKHIAAVELYFKKRGQSLDAVFETDADDPETLAQSQSPAAAFIDALAIGPTQYFHGLDVPNAQSLTLEVTLACEPYRNANYQREIRFMVKLRIADADSEKFYVVRNIQEFFTAYANQETYATSGKATYDLTANALPAAEQELLTALLHNPSPDQYSMGNFASNYRQYVLLMPGDFMRLQSLWPQLAHFQFRPVEAAPVYPTINLVDFAPSLGLWQATVTAVANGFSLQVATNFDLLIAADLLLVAGRTCVRCIPAQLQQMASLFNALPPDDTPLMFAAQEVDRLRDFLAAFKQIGTVTAPATLAPVAMTAHFDLDRQKQAITLQLGFEYGDTVYPAAQVATVKDLPRNREKEQQARDYLKTLGFSHSLDGWQKPFSDAQSLYRFYIKELPNLRQNGVVTTTPALDALVVDTGDHQPTVAVKGEAGLLSISFSMAGIAASEVDAMLAQLDVSRPYVVRPDGRLLVIDDQFKATAKALSQVRQQAQWHDGKLSVSASQALAVQAALGDRAEFDAQFAKIVSDLTHPETFPLGDALSGIHAELRPYQQAGVQWLEMLDHHGFGGILADEMGLGKTLQMITFLHHHRQKPSLVVAPASLQYNWLAEFEKFAPDMVVQVVSGTKAERVAMVANTQADVLITSYNLARLDASEYAEMALGYLVLDEAQYAKNATSKTNQALRKLHPKATFALSGTPIENRSDELWAIFGLVLPGLMPGKKAFNQLTPEEIAVRVRPFILRREKQAVLKDLPAKVESNLTNDMTRAQKTVYLAQLQQMQVRVRGLGDALVKNKLEILAGLTRLRQICDTPSLYMDDYTGGSGKLELLADLLPEAAANGRHVLIFSQFTTMLTQIQAQLRQAHLDSFMLTGETKVKSRLDMVERFNAGEKPFFLISLKAGGTGLNLTGADMVLLVDLWWNPAVEDQAIARAHRIGQKHEVDVYRLITKGTIEEQIVKLQEKKRDLVDTIMSGTANKAGLSADDIRLILGIND